MDPLLLLGLALLLASTYDVLNYQGYAACCWKIEVDVVALTILFVCRIVHCTQMVKGLMHSM